MKVLKRDGNLERFSKMKIRKSLMKTFKACKVKFCQECYDEAINEIVDKYNNIEGDILDVETIQDITENALIKCDMSDIAKVYILYRHDKDRIREFVKQKESFIESYKHAFNTADNTVDDNSNVANKNIGVLNAEIHKNDNIQINRTLITNKLRELYPNFDAKQYCRDLQDHVIYKNDESSFACTSPYCVAGSMYPFLLNGMKDLGGLSAKPKNLDSFCGMYVNFIFAMSSQFAGAVATPEVLLCFDYFARKEWGDDYIDIVDEQCKSDICKTQRTIKEQIHQYFQQIVYSINQPASTRGMQSAFVNFSYFDEPFFHSMFDDFVFLDGTRPIWRTLNWLQKEFMMWFNEERQKCILTFPVESFALIYKDGEFVDKENYQFVCDEYARGHSFFTYMSDTADSLSSCCFDGEEVISVYKNNEKQNISIKDFVENYNNEEYVIKSYNPITKQFENSVITGVLKKEYDDELYEFNIDGKCIKVTPDHIMIVKNIQTDEIEYIPAMYVYKNIDNYLIAFDQTESLE